MTIVYHDDWKINKGEKDAARHRTKIDDAIRKNVEEIIGEESIITNPDGKKTVRVPVKGLKDYQFRHGKKGFAGVGQGDKKAGDILDKRNKQQGQSPGAGSNKGTDYIETEVSIDYIVQIMFDDLGLPYLEEKNKASTLVHKGWKTESISKKGPYSRIHKKRTMIEAIKRNVVLTGEIMEQTGCNEEDAGKALMQAKGDLLEAIEIIKEDKLNGGEYAIIIDDDDLRYKTIDEDIEICSNAVVIAMMDVSASMDARKKYLVRSLLFWMTQFLKTQYEQVQIRFIQHTESAVEVDEDTFFNRGTTGGTYCYTAIEKARHMIEAEYPLDEWNTYCVYCSDGEDFDEQRTVSELELLLDRGINMFAYIEVKPHGDYSNLLPAFKKKWKFEERKVDNRRGNFWVNEDLHFFMSVVRNKKQIAHSLKHFLGIRKEDTRVN